MKNSWRSDPITEKQITSLRRVDEYFTFDRLKIMTKGEASDYIKEYFDDDGKIIPEMINKRGFQTKDYVLKKDVGIWLKKLSEKFIEE